MTAPVNRRDYLGGCVDAVMGYWLAGFGTDDPETKQALEDWWTGEAADSALELVHTVLQAIEDRGYTIVKAP